MHHPDRLREVAAYFVRLGFTAFGGPAAHIALMRDELVKRRQWLSDDEFLDLLGATNLIPGPNSTEMAIHIGYRRAGWAGLIAGGAGFIIPAMLSVLALAWAYVEYGATPQAAALLYGVQPVIIAVVGQALWELGRKAVKDRLTALVGAAALGLYVFGVSELPLLFAGALLVALIRNRAAFSRLASRFTLYASVLPLPSSFLLQPFDLSTLFWTFLRIGSVLYGSGYVLLAFLRADFVEGLGWLTDKQLLDAIAAGQVTPGPVFTTATFIGYLLGGLPGALLATLGIFLPAFVFVALSAPFVARLRRSAWAGGLLDGVNVASLALMAAVTVQLAGAALVDPLTVALALASLIALVRFNVNSTWLVLGGALVGLATAVLRG
jgi:chromate transporter